MQQEIGKSRIAALCRKLSVVGSVSVFALMMLMTIDVFAGKIWQRILWQQEISSWLMVAIIFSALPLVQSERRHIVIGAFTEKLSGRMRAVVDAFILVMSFVISVGLIYWTTLGAMNAWRMRLVTDRLMIPLAPMMFVIPLGLFIMCIVLVLQFVITIKQLGGNGRDA